MANFSLVANSTFQPFTYQELAMPLDRQDAYHENLMQQYEQLSDKADILEAMGKNDKDKNTYAQYKAYSDALRSEADNLYRNGLNSESRLRLTELRRRYNQEIVPIQNAWNKREQEAEMQMKAQLSNPALRFTRDARNTSLEEYINNPTGGYGVVNLNNITAQMAGIAKNLEKQIRSGHREGIDDFTYNFITKHGLDPNFINDWLQHPEKSPTLTNMMNQVLQANGVTLESLRGSQNGESILRDATSAAQMGAWEAVGQDTAQIVQDRKKIMDYEFGQQLKLMEAKEAYEARKEAIKAAAAGMGNVPMVTSVSVGMVPTEAYSAENKKILDTLKAGNKDGLKASYFGKTFGKVNPMKIYQEYHNASGEDGRRRVMDKYKQYGVTDVLSKDQYNTLKAMGYSEQKNLENYRYSNLMDKFNRSVEQRSSYSTNMANYESFNEKAIPNMLARDRYNGGSGMLWEMKRDGKMGNPAKVKDLNLEKNKITDVRYDPQHRGKIVIQVSDGKSDSRLFIADPGIYDSNLVNIIAQGEAAMDQGNASPADITRAIADSMNERNKVKSKTDSKIE
jgi:hypothetical protein